jgi:hypothetical protein
MAAQYTLARHENPDDDIDAIAEIVVNRMPREDVTELALDHYELVGSTSKTAKDLAVDYVREFIIEMEDPYDD